MVELKEAEERLRKVNINLTLLMKEKKALQTFILEENDRVKGIASPESKAWSLKHDTEFVKEHGRERTDKEVARLMNYSLRQVQRFLNKKDS